MTAKEYLQQATEIDLKIEAIETAIQKEYERATSLGGPCDNAPFQNNGIVSDKVGRAGAAISDYKETLSKLKKDAEDKRNEIIVQINSMKSNLYAALLINKYINGLSWEKVAEALGKESVEYVKGELHSKALNNFEDTLRNLTKPPCIF